jgi:hypothetical protein
MQQASRNRTREPFLLRIGRIREPAQLAPQGGEAHAADGVEVGRVHGERLEPDGQAAGGADLAGGGAGAQLLH